MEGLFWKALIFQEIAWTTWRIIRGIQCLYDAILKSHQSTPKQTLLREVRWEPPPATAIKLNLDGIFRDHHGNWILGFTNLKAELFALMHGLCKAWNLRYRNIMCQTDSKLALDLLQGNVDA
ncbi:uncharacterized protein [Glycine max]|uniref:uncharacterized protein n=1 Tax=Glycine max TaxID=3847 RepID=UPI0007191861|nr:uncharacterized protein LOC106797040 [Glycine max]|eukprot:XP_014626209.1 uncharacterized protein LOC106797040 [Glycine max]